MKISIIKILGIVSFILLSSANFAQRIATGVVFLDSNRNGKKEQQEKGISQIAVSNGTDVILTNEKGEYRLPVGNDNIIFVIKPEGYALPVDKDNIPQFYYIHKSSELKRDFKFPVVAPTGTLPNSIDFGLLPTKESDDFQVVLFGDPQPYTEEELEYFNKSIVEEVKQNKEAAFGISLGDIVGDDLSLLPKYKKVMSQIPMTWFNVMGNHDMNYDAKSDKMSDETFEKEFGPANYSFNYGKAHFVILDDILWPDPRDGEGYWGGFRLDQLQFLSNDLSFINKDKLVVICMHIPLNAENGEYFRDTDRRKLFEILHPFENVLILTAHTHKQTQFYHSNEIGCYAEKPIHEYNVGTTSGDWYNGKIDSIGVPESIMRDGTPRGYALLSISGNQYKTEYKVYNKPYDYQFNAYIPKVISQKRISGYRAMVNFFIGGEKDTVAYKIDDTSYRLMKKENVCDWNYTKEVMRWDTMEHLEQGRRPSMPELSSHIWTSRFPQNLSVGTHQFTVKAKDRYGNKFVKTFTFKVE